ncbi:MAG: hypothetical protein JWP49_223 [Phenylobacterium sp.]|nr:hypothetical protein [Phenylobacterium sp.]
MPTTKDIQWFKGQFGAQVAAAVAGTPFDLDMIAALACQETGDIWGPLSRKGLPAQQILSLCVGDVITGPRRKAFPTSRADLLSKPRGSEMYTLAREALAEMAAQVAGYAPYVGNPERFCHAFGILQYDLQSFRINPDYFLSGDYADLGKCLAMAIDELKAAQHRIPTLRGKAVLTDLELAYVAIAYNSGSFRPADGLKQGFKNGEGRYYGELFYDFLELARSVAVPAAPALAAGDAYRVQTQDGPLLLRSVAARDAANIIGHLKNGLEVRSLGEPPVNGFLHVTATVDGAELTGYAGLGFLVRRLDADPVG